MMENVPRTEVAMDSDSRDHLMWLVAIASLGLSAIALLLPERLQIIRVAVVALVVLLLLLFAQRSRYEALGPWLAATLEFLRANVLLLLAAIISAAAIVFLQGSLQASLYLPAQLIMAALLAASIAGLMARRRREASLRLVKGAGDDVYLLEDGVKHHVPDPATLAFVMLDTYRQLERVSDLELRLYQTGKPLASIKDCRLVKGSGNTIYVVWDGRRKGLPDPETALYFFKDKVPEVLTDADLEGVPRTGSLPSILALPGRGPQITIHGDFYWRAGTQKKS
jgi:hypothetical protein